MLAAFLTTILFSLSAISGRRLSDHLGGTLANLVRLLLAGVLLGTWSHLFGFGVGRSVFWILFLSGCVGFGLGDLAMFQAYPRIGTRRTMVLVQCLAAPLAALAEWAWLGHAPTLAQAGFGLLILAGVGVALYPAEGEAQPAHHLTVGVLFGILASIGQGGGAVISRKAYIMVAGTAEAFHTPLDGVNAAYQRMLGGIFVSALFLLYLKIAHRPDDARKANWARAWPWLAGNAIAGPALGVACFQWALMTAPTTVVLPIVATVPLAVTPLEHLLKGETVTRRAIAGGVIAVAGVTGLTLAAR
jgi:drug/metabolite transporter (DMT)-like permease